MKIYLFVSTVSSSCNIGGSGALFVGKLTEPSGVGEGGGELKIGEDKEEDKDDEEKDEEEE
jgi:hypothetical protein